MAVFSTTLKDEIVDCLSQQINEYELLESMYPKQGEIILSDKRIIQEINDFLEGKSQCIPNHLDFKLNLQVSELKLEVFITLPSTYPKEEPDIYVRCNKLNRQNETKLNSELSTYIKENNFGDVCLYTAIAWLQEHSGNFTVGKLSQPPGIQSEIKQSEDKLARLWIYSHHIYNKRKREEIVKRAHELKLTGFCLPGKPGVVCVEGSLDDCHYWWKDIKAMNWKKIMIRKTELFEPSEILTYKKFLSFKELNLKDHACNKHANMSELSKYMNELGLSQVFNEIFRLCNDGDD